MYKIITPTGDSILTEKVNYIRTHKNGVTFILTERDKAEGVAYCGTPYLFKDGAHVCETDSAIEMSSLVKENRESIEQSLTELYLDGVQAQQDITEIQLQLLEG